MVTDWHFGGGKSGRCQSSPENTSPRAAVEAELHVAPCHVDGQEVFAVRVVAVQEDAIPGIWPECDFQLHEGKVVLGLQGPGRGSEGP